MCSGCLRHHPVTGQLSSLLLTILGWRRPGKIGSANTRNTARVSGVSFYPLCHCERDGGLIYVCSGCLRHHPVTGQLSSLLLTILGWRRPGKIGSANTENTVHVSGVPFYPLCHCERSGGLTYVCSGCLRHHPVTGQLSSLLLTILGWRRPGKIGSANTKEHRSYERCSFLSTVSL